jgi:hypothetical protein
MRLLRTFWISLQAVRIPSFKDYSQIDQIRTVRSGHRLQAIRSKYVEVSHFLCSTLTALTSYSLRQARWWIISCVLNPRISGQLNHIRTAASEYDTKAILQIKYLRLQENIRVRRDEFAYRNTFEKMVERCVKFMTSFYP